MSNESSGPYTIVFPIPAYSPVPGRLLVPQGLARDLVSQLKFEPQVRIVVPRARTATDVPNGAELTTREFPGFSFRLLPWSGSSKTFFLWLPLLRHLLDQEARQARVWHTCCSMNIRDLTTESFFAGRRAAGGRRVLGLDSDPAAMLEQGGQKQAAVEIRNRYRDWVSEVDLTVMVGSGVASAYAAYARRRVQTNAVWLTGDDLAPADAIRAKFDEASPIRMALPSRFSAWKGIDDTIKALRDVHDMPMAWTLDIIGEGEDEKRLKTLAHGDSRIRFLPAIPYGPTFFEALRTYHIVIAPTRAQEETRIVYDAAASGCVLLHSATNTLEAALAPLNTRWKFDPANPESLRSAVRDAFEQRAAWLQAGINGRQWMKGRTIDEMHAIRAEAMRELDAPAAT